MSITVDAERQKEIYALEDSYKSGCVAAFNRDGNCNPYEGTRFAKHAELWQQGYNDAKHQLDMLGRWFGLKLVQDEIADRARPTFQIAEIERS